MAGWQDYITATVDGSVYLAGTLYDIAELSLVTFTTLKNIATLNWDEVGKDISSAMTFDNGIKGIEALQKARLDAANKAHFEKQFKVMGDSVIAAREREKEKEKELADAAKETAKALAQSEQERRRAHDQATEAVDKKIATMKQELEIARQIGKMREAGMSKEDAANAEKNLRERMDLKEMGLVGYDVGIRKIQEEKDAIEKKIAERDKDLDKAKELRKENATPSQKMAEEMDTLAQLKKKGLIDQATFDKASGKAYDTAQGGEKKTGAVSAQAGSVEAYKLILQREKETQARATKSDAIRTAQLKALQKIETNIAKQPLLKLART